MKRPIYQLSALRVAAIACGVPLLMVWASRQLALDGAQWLSPSLLVGIALSQLTLAIYAVRFRLALGVVGIEIGLLASARLLSLSLFYQFFLPIGIGADVTKFVTLKARDHTALTSAAGIVLDHGIGLVALLLLAGGVFAWRRPIAIPGAWATAALMVVLGAVAAGMVAAHFRRRGTPDIARLLARMREHRYQLGAALLLALLMQLSFAAAVHVGSTSFNSGLGYFEILFVVACAQLFQALPINLAGAGGVELAGAGLYLALGVAAPTALLLVSLLYVYRLLLAIVGGVWDLIALCHRGGEGGRLS